MLPVRTFLAILLLGALAGLPRSALAERYVSPDAGRIAQAEKFFQAGDWAKAAQELKAVLAASGAESQPGAFYFNLGTALARSGAVGEGYVALLRASSLLPFDGDVRQHLHKVEQAVPLTAKTVRPALWLGFWPSSLRVVSGWLWLLAGLTCSALALWLLNSSDKALPVSAGSLAAVLFLMAGLSWLQDRLPVSGTVAVTKVKSGPGATFTDITSLDPGSLVNVDGDRDGWKKIRFRKGDSEETVGWVEPAGLLGVR